MAAGEGLERLFAELGAHVVPGGETLNPSTYELLAGIHEVPAEEVLVFPSSSNVIMAAERACELSEKPARVVAATSQQESLLALVELDPDGVGRRRTPSGSRPRSDTIAAGGVAPAARDDAQGRFRKGDAVGFVGEEIVAWGGAGSTLAATIEKLAEGAEIVTVIGGAGAPRSRSTSSTRTSPTGSRSRPTTAVSRAGGGCSPPSSARLRRQPPS